VKKENTILLGYPAIDYKNFYRSSVVFRQLPELKRKIEELEKEIGQLKKA